MEVKPSHYIIGILGFVFFIMAGITMIGEFQAADATFATDENYEDFNKTFNVYDDVQDKVGDLESSVVNADPDIGLFGVLNGLISSAWQTLKLTISSFSFMNGVYNGLSTMFGIPTWVGGLIILAVSTMFVFAIFAAIFQRDL